MGYCNFSTFTAPSYSKWDVASVLSSAEEEKKRKYNDAAEARRASFTPLVVSVDGVLGREAECFIQLLADKIAEIIYSEVAEWIRARLPSHFEGHQSMTVFEDPKPNGEVVQDLMMELHGLSELTCTY